MDSNALRTWVEVDTRALHKNYRLFRRLISKKTRLMVVAKSNAYGHDLITYVKTMKKFGADWLGVDSIAEARALRAHGIRTPILILGYTVPKLLREARDAKVSVTISNFAHLDAASRLKKNREKLRVHIKIDTGMHRQGFFQNDISRVIDYFLKHKDTLALEGAYTHFAAAKNPAFPRDTKKQMELFEKAVSQIKAAGLSPLVHAAATSGAIVFPEAHYNMVRIGIGMYGLWPSIEVRAAFGDEFKLTPVLSWRTIISEIKILKKGDRSGYDFTEAVMRDSRIAVCPIGYWHGYRRALSSIGHVIIQGERAKVLGRVSMDMIVIDVTKIKDAKVGDAVTLLGRDKKEEITADEIAALTNTINYEVVTQINPLIRRKYL